MAKWDDLLPELLILILSSLSGKDVLNFGLVCKLCNNVVRYSPYKNYPYMLFYSRKEMKWVFSQHDSSFLIGMPQLESKSILCSKFGWLLMRGNIWSKQNPFFFNPFSKCRIELPQFVLLSYFGDYTFFNGPTSSDCIVLGFRMLTHSTIVNICLVGLDGGHCQEYSYHSEIELNVCGCSPVIRGRLIFFIDMKGNILTFDMGNLSWNLHLDCLSPPGLQNKIKERFLILDGEDILGVFVYRERDEVGIYRLSCEMKWIQLHNIGNRACYVSSSASFAMTSPSTANRIYFDKFYRGNALFYSLESEKYESHTAEIDNRENYAFTKYGTWIFPPRR